MITQSRRFSVFHEFCPSRQLLTLITGKWTVLVMYALRDGVKRHGELERMIGSVSQKMLTQTLRQLERDGLVQRKAYPLIPPVVEYSLTTLGCTLIRQVDEMCGWAQEHVLEVEAARSHYDANNQEPLEAETD